MRDIQLATVGLFSALMNLTEISHASAACIGVISPLVFCGLFVWMVSIHIALDSKEPPK